MPKVVKKKCWIELRVLIHPDLGEVVSNFLIEEGSPGIIQENVLSSLKGKRDCIIAYFPNDQFSGSKKKKIQAYLLNLGQPRRDTFSLRSRIIGEEKWAEAWKANFKPIRITPRIVVKPPWEEYSAPKEEIVIEIDPGMAFGTGTHPSTHLCLQFLDEKMASFPGQPSVLDVGTGSGILAIAARKLGAKPVLGLDIDPVAIASARKNAAGNKVAGEIYFRVGTLGGLGRGFDIVLANLLPQEILSMVSLLPAQIAPGGVLIISGFLPRQRKEIAGAFAGQKLQIRQYKVWKGWACFVMGRINGRE